ncbi:hypothetical protein FOA52_010808, partial [Chlamydomonas sp. UWO 241]
ASYMRREEESESAVSDLRSQLARARGETHRPPGQLSRAEQQAVASKGAIDALHTEVIEEIEGLLRKQAVVLKHEEGETIKKFKEKLCDVESQVMAERSRAATSSATTLAQKNAELRGELERTREIATKIDEQYKATAEECTRLRAQYKCQEDDRQLIVRQLVAQKLDKQRMAAELVAVAEEASVVMAERDAAVDEARRLRTSAAATTSATGGAMELDEWGEPVTTTGDDVDAEEQLDSSCEPLGAGGDGDEGAAAPRQHQHQRPPSGLAPAGGASSQPTPPGGNVDYDRRIARYEDVVATLKRMLDAERKRTKQARAAHTAELASRTELQSLLRQCVDDVRMQRRRAEEGSGAADPSHRPASAAVPATAHSHRPPSAATRRPVSAAAAHSSPPQPDPLTGRPGGPLTGVVVAGAEAGAGRQMGEDKRSELVAELRAREALLTRLALAAFPTSASLLPGDVSSLDQLVSIQEEDDKGVVAQARLLGQRAVAAQIAATRAGATKGAGGGVGGASLPHGSSCGSGATQPRSRRPSSGAAAAAAPAAGGTRGHPAASPAGTWGSLAGVGVGGGGLGTGGGSGSGVGGGGGSGRPWSAASGDARVSDFLSGRATPATGGKGGPAKLASWGRPVSAAPLLSAALALGFLATALVLVVVVSTRRKFSAVASIPTFDESHIIWGHLPWFTSPTVHKELAKQAKILGPIYRIRMVVECMVFVSDPAEVARICMRGEDYMDKATAAYNSVNVAATGPTTTNLLSSHTDDQWRLLRKALSPCFSSANMKAALPVIQSVTAKIMDQIEAAGPTQAYDVVDLARRVTAEVIGRWGFKTSFGADDLSKPSKIVSMMDGFLNAIHRLWSNPFWAISLLTSKEARVHRANSLVYDSFMDNVTRELQARPLDELPTDCIAGALLRATELCGKPLPFHQLKSNISIMLAAGFETSASAFGSIVVSLLQHPAELARLEDELDAFGLLKTPKRPEARAVVWDDLGRMTFLNAVIKETLRWQPPANLGTVRVSTKMTKICGHDVPAGTWIALPGGVIDRSTAVYGEDADKFRPDRWLSHTSESGGKDGAAWAATGAYDDHGDNASSGAVDQAPAALAQDRLKEPIAFSMGPRDCVGQALARLELQVFIAELFSRFRVSLAPGMGSPKEIFDRQIFHVTLSFDGEVLLRMEPR